MKLPTTNVAIIGASLFGFSLAIALPKGFVTYTIHDVRPCLKSIGGAIVLCSNAPVIIDKPDAFVHIQPENYGLGSMTSTPVQRTEYDVGIRSGYGYFGVRVYHHVVIKDLWSSGASAHSRYLYGVVSSGSEALSGRTWAFASGRTGGAIYPYSTDSMYPLSCSDSCSQSTLPRHRAAAIQHRGETTDIPTTQISLETTAEQYSLLVIIMNQPHGAFMMAGGSLAVRSSEKDLLDLGAQ